MNLPTLAVILGGHQIKKIYGSTKIIKKANDLIVDTGEEFTCEMSGYEITAKIKLLEERDLADILITTDIVEQSNVANILHQIEIISTHQVSTQEVVNKSKDVLFTLFTLVLSILSLISCFVYYTNSSALNMEQPSNVISIIARLLEDYNEIQNNEKITNHVDVLNETLNTETE